MTQISLMGLHNGSLMEDGVAQADCRSLQRNPAGSQVVWWQNARNMSKTVWQRASPVLPN